jgi:hypothetical protein
MNRDITSNTCKILIVKPYKNMSVERPENNIIFEREYVSLQGIVHNRHDC